MSSRNEVFNDQISKMFDQVNRGKLSATTRQEDGNPGIIVPFSFNGTGVFDDTEFAYVFLWVPEVMLSILSAQMVVSFREFFASATTVSSGGGSTSGSGGGATSSSDGSHRHRMWTASGLALVGGTDAAVKARSDAAGASEIRFDLAGGSAADTYTYDADGDHTHTVGAHTHSTPAHTHALEYGMFEESFPASHDVTIRVSEWDGSAWDEIAIITDLTSDLEEVDLTDYIDAPGKYRISFRSTSSQPNDGRLGFDVAGHVVGVVQPR